MKDDRKQFELEKRESARQLASDQELQKKNWQLYELADKHNYSYLWSWMGVPIIQNPADIVTMQELIWRNRPDVIIETGVARGGSIVLYASLCEIIGSGKVIGIDIDVRMHNRDSIESSLVSERIQLIEGSSVEQGTIDKVIKQIPEDSKVMVILDSNHTHDHVLSELRLYSPLVTAGQSLVVADTSVEYIPASIHRGERPWSKGNNPKTAMDEFMLECDRFVLDEFANNKLLMTSTPGGYYKCVK